MKEDRIRRYATEQLWKTNAPADEQACICDRIAVGENGWDAAIAEGLQTLDDDAVVGALPVSWSAFPREANRSGGGVDEDDRADRADHLAKVAAADGEIATRVYALAAIAGNEDFKDTMVALLDSPQKELRAAASGPSRNQGPGAHRPIDRHRHR